MHKKQTFTQTLKKQIYQDRFALMLSVGLAVAYFIFSKFSEGFYQHDEAGHFVNMRSFWHDPFVILGNWAKPGYKLIYVIPALFGEQAVIFVNCLFSGFTSFLVYKILKQFNSKFAILGFFLLAMQPLWMQLSFRNYSEIISAFLLTLAVYLHYKKSFNWAIFVLSYLTLIRQEFYPIVGLYGLYILFSRKYIAVVYAVIPQLLITIWGYLNDGSLFYIFNSVIHTSDTISDAYPRQGFDHYFKMSQVIFSSVVLTLVVSYLFLKIYKRNFKQWALILPALLYLLIHSIFNAHFLDFGPATGGNLRYMIIISPLMSVMAACLFDDLKGIKKKYQLLFILIPFLIVLGMFMSFKHNNIKYNEIRDFIPFYFAIAVSFFIFFPLKKISVTAITITVIVLMILLDASYIKPFEQNGEDRTMRTVAEWYEEQITQSKDVNKYKNVFFDENSQVFATNILFHYFQGKTPYDYKIKSLPIDSLAIDSASIGSLIIWDSHYSFRPKLRKLSLPVNYFLDRPFEFANIKNFANKKFSVKVFVKVSESDSVFDKGKEKLDAKKYDEALECFNRVLSENMSNYIAFYYRGKCYEGKNDIQQAYGDYLKAVNINERFGQGHFGIATILLKTRNLDKSIEEFTKAINLEMSNEIYYLMRGNAYFSKRDFNNAEKDYAYAINLRNKFPEAFYNLGIAQINNKKKKPGCTNLNNALKLGYKQAQEAIDKYCK